MVSCFQRMIINLIANALCLEETIFILIYTVTWITFNLMWFYLFFEDEGMLHNLPVLHLSNLNNSDRWICAEILFEWTHDLWDEPIKIWEAFSPFFKADKPVYFASYSMYVRPVENHWCNMNFSMHRVTWPAAAHVHMRPAWLEHQQALISGEFDGGNLSWSLSFSS